MKTTFFRVLVAGLAAFSLLLLGLGLDGATAERQPFLVWILLGIALAIFPILFWFAARIWNAPKDELKAAKIAVILIALTSVFASGQFFDWTVGAHSLRGLGLGVAFLFGPLLFVSFVRVFATEISPSFTRVQQPFRYVWRSLYEGLKSVPGVVIVALAVVGMVMLGLPEGAMILLAYVGTLTLLGLGDMRLLENRIIEDFDKERARWATLGFEVGGLVFVLGLLSTSVGFSLPSESFDALLGPLQLTGVVLMAVAPLYIVVSLAFGAINYDLFGPSFLRRTTFSYGSLTVLGVFIYAGLEEVFTQLLIAGIGAELGWAGSFLAAGCVGIAATVIHSRVRKIINVPRMEQESVQDRGAASMIESLTPNEVD